MLPRPSVLPAAEKAPLEAMIAGPAEPGLCAGGLLVAAVGDDLPAPGFHDRDVDAGARVGGLAPEALDGDLEVNDRRGLLEANRDGRGVRDHPLVGVGRHVRKRLVDLARLQRQGALEEGCRGLVRRQAPQRLDRAPHRAGIVRAAAVDEGGLADASRKQVLQVDEALLGRLQRGTVVANPVLAVTGQLVEVAVGGVVRGHQRERARPLEVVLELLRLLAGLAGKGAVQRIALAPVIVSRGADGDGQQSHRQQKGYQRDHVARAALGRGVEHSPPVLGPPTAGLRAVR